MTSDLLIINGKGLSMADNGVFEWIFVQDKHIVDLGHGKDYEKYLGGSTRVIDAKGGSVLPGFIDSHFHVVQASLNSRSVDLNMARTFKDIGEAISQASKKNPGKAIRGIRLDRQNLKEKRMPDRTVLDKYCKDVPVFINSVEYQTSSLNTYALLYYKIPFTLTGIEFDENQVPTGVISKQANMILRENVLRNIPDSTRLEAVTGFLETVIASGITTVNAMEGGRLYSDKDADFIYEYSDRLAIDIALFYQTMDTSKVKHMGIGRIGGCLYVDGTFGARTSALSFEYADAPGNMGGLNFTQEELNDFVLGCYQNHLQLGLYTIGDRAIEQAIVAHEYALEKTGVIGLRHRLEHVELPTESHIRRAKNLDLIFSMSPTYETIWGGPNKLYAKRLGDNYKITNPFREIMEEGVLVCGGSDCDVTPADPILGIYSAVNHPVLNHRVDLYDAIKMFTINGAYAIFQEDSKGSLEVGKIADIVILDSNILECPKDKINGITVKTTVKNGRIILNKLQ